MDFLMDQAELLMSAQPLLKKYEKRLNMVAKNVPNFQDHEAYTLAILLDNTEQAIMRYARRKALSDVTYSEVVGPFIKHAFNIISAIYTTLEIKDFISIQPLLQKRGDLYYLQYKYGSNQGDVQSGNYMFSPNNPPKRSGYYGSQIVYNEPVSISGTGTATFAYAPIVGGWDEISVVISGGSTNNGTYVYRSFDSVTNIVSLAKLPGTTEAATLNVVTGLFTLTTGNNTGITGTVATYKWDSEKYSTNSKIPRVTISVDQIPVQAERNQLLFDIMLDATYDFEKQFGRDLNSEVQAAVIQALQNQIAYRVLGEMYRGATGNVGSTFTFDLDTPTEVSYYDHAQDLLKLFGQASMRIYNNLGRGLGNNIITGSSLVAYLKGLPTTMFQRVDNPDIKGPQKVGNLNGDYNVYFNPDMPTDEWMMTYKGTNWWEATYFIGSYLPIMATKFMMFPDLHGEQGYISMEAYKLLFPTQIVKGTVTGLGS